MTKYRVGNSGTKMEIKDDWLVLDIGSGHNPHPRANVLTDRYIEENVDRSGKPIKVDEKRPFIICDAQCLPFKSKVFDYIIASHIAEHAESPENFCNELIRISKRGYIETPSKFGEIFLTEPFHKWYVCNKGSVLFFEKKKNDKPLSESFYRIFYFDITRVGHKTLTHSNACVYLIFKSLALAFRRLWVMMKNITYTCFEWEDNFDFKIDD
jgi:ubiquinone/menaquinone biosynthesis C-methylase UbiE